MTLLNNKVILFICIGLINPLIINAQVGIGTTTPTAELEVTTTTNGIPGLELNPQTAPVGTANGQIAVIDNNLFMYDLGRSKWTSVNTMPLQFARNGNVDNSFLQFGGNMSSGNSGALLPRNGTIVAVTAIAAGGDTDKLFQLRVRSGNSNQSTTNFNLINSEYIDTSLDIPFNSGDYIVVRVQNAGGNVQHPAVIVWIKWTN